MSLTKVTYSMIAGAQVNVLDYGADATGATDSTAAIQAAIDAAIAGQGEVYIPAGTYLTGRLTFSNNNITVRGEGSAYSYNSSAAPKTILKAKTGTTVVVDLVSNAPFGIYICDLEVDGNNISGVGIDCSGANIIERVQCTRNSIAGIRFFNLTNSMRLINSGCQLNSGYGLLVQGTSTTTYSVEGCVFSLNTAGGIDIQAGVLSKFTNCVIESNTGPGLRIYKPNTHLNAFYGITFDNCWFEDNASTAPNYTLVVDSGTTDSNYAAQKITFNQCHFSVANVAYKFANIRVAKWLQFNNCDFSNSTDPDAIAIAATGWYVSFINSVGVLTGMSNGLTTYQASRAVDGGYGCYFSTDGLKLEVGVDIPFTNSWENYGGAFQAAKYWFDKSGNVHLEGSIKSGTIPSTAFQLSPAFRPTLRQDFAVDSNAAYGMVIVDYNGTVVPYVGNNTIVNLDGIVYSITN